MTLFPENGSVFPLWAFVEDFVGGSVEVGGIYDGYAPSVWDITNWVVTEVCGVFGGGRYRHGVIDLGVR